MSSIRQAIYCPVQNHYQCLGIFFQPHYIIWILFMLEWNLWNNLWHCLIWYSFMLVRIWLDLPALDLIKWVIFRKKRHKIALIIFEYWDFKCLSHKLFKSWQIINCLTIFVSNLLWFICHLTICLPWTDRQVCLVKYFRLGDQSYTFPENLISSKSNKTQIVSPYRSKMSLHNLPCIVLIH